MIEIKDLRVGNLITDKWASEGSAFEVISLSSKYPIIKYGAKFSANIKHIRPIPLTEEWLLKFGFEKKELYGWKGNGDDYRPETNKTEYQDYVIDAGDEDYFFVRYSTWSYRKTERAEEHVSCVKMEYVHQLQNLYFALTGNELTVR